MQVLRTKKFSALSNQVVHEQNQQNTILIEKQWARSDSLHRTKIEVQGMYGNEVQLVQYREVQV